MCYGLFWRGGLWPGTDQVVEQGGQLTTGIAATVVDPNRVAVRDVTNSYLARPSDGLYVAAEPPCPAKGLVSVHSGERGWWRHVVPSLRTRSDRRPSVLRAAAPKSRLSPGVTSGPPPFLTQKRIPRVG